MVIDVGTGARAPPPRLAVAEGDDAPEVASTLPLIALHAHDPLTDAVARGLVSFDIEGGGYRNPRYRGLVPIIDVSALP